MACLSSLVEIRDADSISSLIPFLGHPHWRVRTHTLELIRTIGNRATLPLCQSFSSLNDSRIKAGIMEALTLLVDEKAFPTIFLVTVSEDSYVRREATKALFATTGLLHFERMLVLLKASTDEVVLSGLETALLKFQRETTEAQIISKALLKNLHETTPEAFGSFSYILAELGGWENLNALAQSVLSRKATFAQHALEALSLSPDAKANQHLIHTLEQSAGQSLAFQIGRMASRRLVMDAEDGGFLSDDERYTYAEKILAVVSEPTVLKLLGNFYGKDSTELLYSFLEQGTVEISDAALEGLISIALNLNKISSPNELDSTIEILRKAEVHLTEERFGVEDFLTGKPLFPKTQEQLSLLTASLQPYSNHENSSTP
jgi:HEAT repeat protein